MPWVPSVSAIINDQDCSDFTVADVRLNLGKSGLLETLKPGYGNLNLISGFDGIPVDLHDEVQLNIETASGPYRIFTGRISDKRIEFADETTLQTTLTAITRLAEWGRVKVGGEGFPASLDGERINNILVDLVIPISWESITGTWLDQNKSWDAKPDFIETIDSGEVELGEYLPDFADAASLLRIAELSGAGHLYETTDGRIGYAEATRRQSDFAENLAVIPGQYVLMAGIKAESSTGSIVNRYRVKDYLGNLSIVENLDSQGIFGIFEADLDTAAIDSSTAEYLADRLLNFNAFSSLSITQFTVRLSLLPEDLRESLIRVYVNMPVRIQGLPSAIKSGDFDGFVEGWDWLITENDAYLSLNLSDVSLSTIPERWNSMNQLIQWTSAPSGLAWENARVIA